MPKILPPNPRNRVRDLRQRKGWSQQKLADKANLHVTTIQRIESAKFKGPVQEEVQELIAEALGESRETVFLQIGIGDQGSSRRQFLESIGIAGASLSVGIWGIAGAEDAFGITKRRYNLSNDEMETLIHDNHATWQEFNSLHMGVRAIAYPRWGG
jgi:transcriptional regulator with XRE-family HTH domain